MAVFNEPTKWQTSLVNSGDANVIPQSTPVGTGEASFDDGFPQITQVPIGAGGIAPDRKDFNGLFKILGDWIFFNQNGGLPTYSADFDYVEGRYVVYNNTLYKCIQANGTSSTVVAPDSVSPLGSDYWKDIENQETSSSLIPNQIIQSPIPLTDANLHLLDGALLSGDGAYADYVDLIAELFNGGTASSSFCTEAEWQTSNTNYGFCNKFVYDSVANTVRLPKVNSEHGALIKSYSGGSDGYRIYEDGWCEQWGRIIQGTSSVQVTFAIPYKDTNYSISYTQGSEDNDYETGTDAIKKGSLATTGFIVHRYVAQTTSYWHTCGYVDLSDLQVSPIYEYIVIGTISKTDIQVNIDNVMSDLALKADKDLSNVSGIVRSVNSYRFIYWETDYFDIEPSGLYSFDLSNTDFANISKDAVNVQMIAKVKTAQNGFKIGDYVYTHFANYIGNATNVESGSTPYISDNVLSIRFGNDAWLVEATPNSGIAGILKTGVQVKLILTTWIKEV